MKVSVLILYWFHLYIFYFYAICHYFIIFLFSIIIVFCEEILVSLPWKLQLNLIYLVPEIYGMLYFKCWRHSPEGNFIMVLCVSLSRGALRSFFLLLSLIYLNSFNKYLLSVSLVSIVACLNLVLSIKKNPLLTLSTLWWTFLEFRIFFMNCDTTKTCWLDSPVSVIHIHI